MLLIKCSCGCLFSVKDDVSPDRNILKCQSCGNKVEYYPAAFELTLTRRKFSDANMTVQKIPDDAKITISFDA